MRQNRVAQPLFFTRCDVFCDLLQYTCTEKCYLFVLYNKNGLSKDFESMKKEKQVCWRDLTTSVCVLFNTVDHSQQPMTMHTELQKSRYCIIAHIFQFSGWEWDYSSEYVLSYTV